MQHELNIPSYAGGFEQLSKDVSKAWYKTQAFFYDSFGVKMQEDATADRERGRVRLSAALFAVSKCLYLVRDMMIFLTAIDQQHPKKFPEIPGYTNNFDPITKEAGDMRYDRLAEFLECLASETHSVFLNVQRESGDKQEIEALAAAVDNIMTARTQVDIAWLISEPFMKPDGSC